MATKVERPVLLVVLELDVDDGRYLAVQHLYLLGDDVESHHLVVLRLQDGVGETDILPWYRITSAGFQSCCTGKLGAALLGDPQKLGQAPFDLDHRCFHLAM